MTNTLEFRSQRKMRLHQQWFDFDTQLPDLTAQRHGQVLRRMELFPVTFPRERALPDEHILDCYHDCSR
ncbi:hypothetical protein QM646_00845 [Rhodococcus erythropolis]|nr:hypothetical protein [Rhodococcus erythropolis]